MILNTSILIGRQTDSGNETDVFEPYSAQFLRQFVKPHFVIELLALSLPRSLIHIHSVVGSKSRFRTLLIIMILRQHLQVQSCTAVVIASIKCDTLYCGIVSRQQCTCNGQYCCCLHFMLRMRTFRIQSKYKSTYRGIYVLYCKVGCYLHFVLPLFMQRCVNHSACGLMDN